MEVRKKNFFKFFLPKCPAIFMQEVAGNSPSLPLRPPIQGASRNAVETLLWKGSSQASLLPLCETHLKQSMLYPAKV